MADESTTPTATATATATSPEPKRDQPPQAASPKDGGTPSDEHLEKGYHGDSAADLGYESRPQDVAEFGKFTDYR